MTVLEIILRYSSEGFLVTIAFYISELDVKLDKAAHNAGKCLPGVHHRYQIPVQSLNCWRSVGIIRTMCVCKCLPWSSEISRILRGLGNTETNPARWVWSSLPWQNSSSSIQTLWQLVQCWLSLPAEFRFPAYGGHEKAQTTCTNCVGEK